MPTSRAGFGDACQSDDMVSATTPNGKSYRINKGAAEQLSGLANAFHSRVEPIDTIGGYNCRAITGGNSWSNHAWGLAIDINASAHPYGAGGTFSGSQVKQIRAILADYPQIRWGGDYNTNPDEMHFEWMDEPQPQNGGAVGGSGGSASPTISAIGSLGEGISFVTDSNNWKRLGLIVGGALAIILGLILFMAESSDLTSIVKGLTNG